MKNPSVKNFRAPKKKYWRRQYNMNTAPVPMDWQNHFFLMLYFQKVIYRFNTISINTSMIILTEKQKTKNKNPILKSIWKHRRPWIASAGNPCRKSNTGHIRVPHLKFSYRTIVTKTAWAWCKNSCVDQKKTQKQTQLQLPDVLWRH